MKCYISNLNLLEKISLTRVKILYFPTFAGKRKVFVWLNFPRGRKINSFNFRIFYENLETYKVTVASLQLNYFTSKIRTTSRNKYLTKSLKHNRSNGGLGARIFGFPRIPTHLSYDEAFESYKFH